MTFECKESRSKILILHYGVHHLQSGYTAGHSPKTENKFLVNLIRRPYIYSHSLEWYEDKGIQNWKQFEMKRW